MKGDFSKWAFNPADNFSGVLHQQGRVLLDVDWNAATQIENYWQITMGQDAIGPSLAGVPAAFPNSFKVTQASSDGTAVTITLKPGRVWADGMPVYLPGTTDVNLKAEYLGPPIQDPEATAASIANGIRDAVVLEVWEEAFSAFQDPLNLIEPALGGSDTTERIKVSYGLKLLRLGASDECGNLANKLADNFGNKGKLTTTLSPTLVLGGDCPVEAGGGYTGFEHYLYRVEIATPDAGNHARFKWSQFNGGLVGRGVFTSTGAGTGTVDIKANDQMINQSGLTAFYLEALKFDTDLGYWHVVYTADATLPQDGTLSLTNGQGTWPATSPNTGFFRLWNGIALISAFPTGLVQSNPLQDGNGILLAFETPAVNNSNYTPGDYWTFPVRASGVPFDLSILPNNTPPQGIHYHRVPLGILNWDGGPVVTITAANNEISDCRHVFQPLTKLKGCCTYTVGDDMISFGDFSSIQTAINALPLAGGRVCVLPGVYTENIAIAGRNNIEIQGCGPRSKIIALTTQAVIKITRAQNIIIESLALVAHNTGVGIHITNDAPSQNISMTCLTINAATRSAIECGNGSFITIKNSTINMNDASTPWPGIFVIGDDVLIENNVVTVQRTTQLSNGLMAASAGRGGIQIGGTSERVRIINNLIDGGMGNGITLGSVHQAGGGIIFIYTPWVVNMFDPCDPCAPGDTYVPPGGGTGNPNNPTYESDGSLYEILIERNRIYDMGLNGIGVVAFFDPTESGEIISVAGLSILRNDIRRCLTRSLEVIPKNMLISMGYGGISLADVEKLVIQHNVIEDNGPNHLEPICGIFVLHAEGVDITDNRIVNNGFKTGEPANGAKLGPRGGIIIMLAVTPIATNINQKMMAYEGTPAVKIHDNIVSQPLGQALALAALGPVSVVDNQLTSLGAFIRFNPLSPQFIAGTVMILDLGMSDELPWASISAKFGAMASGGMNLGSDPNSPSDSTTLPVMKSDVSFKRLGRGNILFTDNQIALDLVEEEIGFMLSSIAIFTLDDIGFLNNQSDISVEGQGFVILDALIFGISTRVGGNRFKEEWNKTFYSAMTAGLMNATTVNQSTHCLVVLGLIPSLKVEAGNAVLLEGLFPNYFSCGRNKAILTENSNFIMKRHV